MARTWTQSGPVSMDADLLWKAAIDDQTGTFFRDFDRNVDELSNRSKQTFDKMETGSRQSAAAIGLIAGAVSAVTTQLINMGMRAIMQFPKIIKSATQVAARAETLAVALRTVGGNAGYSSAQMAEFEEAMKSNGITTIQTRQALLKMAQANLDLSKASQLARVAQDAAVIAGTNSSEAFGRMIHGITTLSPLILRNLGIVVNAQYEYKQFATEMGITAQQMDYNTKQQIMLNAVLRAGERIQGTYTAAMGTAGKQAGSLARHQEEVMLALGKIAQPMYLEWIQFMTRELKALREWFDENKDSLEDLGNTLGLVVGVALDLLSALIKLTGILPDLVFKGPLKLLMADMDDFEERWSNLGAYAAQFFSMAAGGWAQMVTWLSEVDKVMGSVLLGLYKFAQSMMSIQRLDFEGAMSAAASGAIYMAEAVDRAAGAAERAMEVGDEVFLEWAYGLGALERDAEDAADGLDGLVDSMAAIAAETEATVAAITELNQKIGEELAEIAKQQARQNIDAAIREARRREDLARRHQERIDDILRDAAEDRAETIADLADDERKLAEDQARERYELERDQARNLLEIEIGYRRRLEDIQRQFDEDASEAARRNDAVTLARLIRQNKRNLKEAEITRDRDVDDAQRSYDQDLSDLIEAQKLERDELRKAAKERMDDLEKDLAARLKAADESRQKDLENLERSLERERLDRARHRAWEEQDRQDKYAAELEAMAAQFASLQYIDEVGLRYLLEQHGEFIADDLALWDAYYKAREHQHASSRWGGWSEWEQSGENYGWGGMLDTSGDEWGFAGGGMGLAMGRQTVTVGENEPEVVAALPLSRIATHNVQFSDWNVNVNGVTPQTEAELVPIMTGMMNQLALALRSALVGGGNVAF